LSLVTSYTYHPNSGLHTVTDISYFDSNDTQTYQYTYDKSGNILTKATGDGTYEYDYDDLYCLTDVTNPTLDDEAYSYDPVGNRLTASGVSGDIEHNANNELSVYGDISFEYDANGNMTSKTSASESWEYTYNVQNRLGRVEEDDLLIAEYGYDPFGRRLWKEVDGTRIDFLYSLQI
jgi:YD repeat-containing protein